MESTDGECTVKISLMRQHWKKLFDDNYDRLLVYFKTPVGQAVKSFPFHGKDHGFESHTGGYGFVV